MDTLQGIKVFCRVVEAGSFVGAAERMEMSTAMVSKHVAGLEERLGIRLLNRTTRKQSLTQSGLAYYERCSLILEELDEVEVAVQDENAVPRGTIKVSTLTSFGARHLSPAIGAYSEKYPDVSVELHLSDRTVDVIEEGYDVAIRAAVGELRPSTLIAKPIAASHFLLCAAPSYFDCRGRPERPEDLAHHNCLVFVDTAFGNFWPLAMNEKRINVKVSGSLSANSGDALRAAAIGGMGIIYLPTDIIGHDVAAGSLEAIPQFDVIELVIYAVYPTRRHLSSKVRTFIDFLSEYFNDSTFGVS